MAICYQRVIQNRILDWLLVSTRSTTLFLCIGFATTAFLISARSASSSEPQRPNIVLMMADDLGFSDIGCYGGEIATPNLDRLAENGLKFTQFYNTGRCWPTRGALLTGYYAQAIRRDRVPGVQSGGRGVRPDWAPLLSTRLKAAGYHSYHSGKWHMDGMPCGNGFDRSYYLRDQHRFFSPTGHFLDDKKLPPIERGSGFYGTVAIADHAVEFLKGHAREHADAPFFLYMAFTAPHFPLHALPDDIAKYRDQYDSGWQAARKTRWRKIQNLGLVTGDLSPVERDLGPPYDFPAAIKQLGTGEVNRPIAWKELTSEQKGFQAAKMAVHAAMVDRIDQEIGRVISQLESMHSLEDTLVLFLSDNGASAEIMVRGDGHQPDAAPGSADSHLCLGPGWSTVSNTPFRRHKTWVHEGGIATPLIVHWPSRLRENSGLRKTPAHVVDLVPTILEIAQATPGDANIKARPFDGRSLVEAFTKDVTLDRESLWWLHEGNRAIRRGDWKLVAAKGDDWELYNLATDRTETRNLAADHPQQRRALATAWEFQWSQIQLRAKSR